MSAGLDLGISDWRLQNSMKRSLYTKPQVGVLENMHLR